MRVIDVDALPRRTAHAVHALMEARNGYGPFTVGEIIHYDEEALSVRHTAAALRAAQRLGLVVYIPGRGEGFWTPIRAVLDQRADFETRYLRDTEDGLA